MNFEIDKISDIFAQAAVDGSRWNAAMDASAEATGSVGALLFPIQGRFPEIPRSPSMAESFARYVDDGWIDHDERYRGQSMLARRGVTTEFDFITPDAIRGHPCYQEFLAPCGLRWFAGVKMGCGDDLWCLSLQRSIVQEPFSQSEQEQLAELSRRLASAAALTRALGFARAEAAMAAFEATDTAVVLLDSCREVLKANSAAERLIGPDIQIVHRRIVSFDHAATVALDRALHQLLWTRVAPALMPPVVLPRRDKRPVLACPLRLTGVTGEPLAACQAVLVLVDLDRRARPTEAVLRSTFGLTKAEARLCNALASGIVLSDAADQICISKETARTELKAVFDKTQTRRQGELMALLARLHPVQTTARDVPSH